MQPHASSPGGTGHIIGFVYFTFICYLSIGLPLAVLPAYVHLRMGYSAALAGLVISIQYIATLASRPWAGRISDHAGAKVAVLWGRSSPRRVCCRPRLPRCMRMHSRHRRHDRGPCVGVGRA